MSYSISIQTDTGFTLYQKSYNMPNVTQQSLSLIQAFYQACEENNGEAQIIFSNNGIIAFNSLKFKKEDQIIIFLISQNIGLTSEQIYQWIQQILYNIRNLLIFHIGINDFEEDLNKNIKERLKKQLRVLETVFDNMFLQKQDQIQYIFRPECLFNSLKLSSNQQKNQKILNLMSNIQKTFKVDHFALWLQDKIYYQTKPYQKIHEADKQLLFLYKIIYKESIINDIPIYLTHTSLVDNLQKIGIVPYRYIIMQFSELFTLTLVSDPSLDINQLYQFVKKNVNLEMSQIFQDKSLLNCALAIESPPLCLAWLLIDHKEHYLFTYAYKLNENKFDQIIVQLYLQLPFVKENQIQVYDDDKEVIYQSYLYVEEGNMQIYQLVDKNQYEMVILYEKQTQANVQSLNFFKKILEMINNDQYNYY